MRGHMGLGLRSRLANPFLVARFVDRAAVWIAFIKQLRKEVAISVFVEDQFGLGRYRVGLCVTDFEESGSREPSALVISIAVRSVLSR